MSLVEQARTRLEETRDRIKERIESVRGGSSSSNAELPMLKDIREKGVLGALRGSGSSPELLSQIREKGVLSVLEERFPKVKEMRGEGILGGQGILGGGAIERIRERGILRGELGWADRKPWGGQSKPTRGQTVDEGPLSVTDEAAKIEFTDAISIEPS